MSFADDPRPGMGLRRVVNAAGTMTALGASSGNPEAIEAAGQILPWFVEIDALQRLASEAIARATGAAAGMVTASASAGVTLGVAATMAGDDRRRIAQLPDTAGMPSRVIVQSGHLIDYGAPLDQAIRLAGARVVRVGTQNRASLHEIEAALAEPAAAAVYVVSHHTGTHAGISLADFTAACSGRGVPVIVDAASEYDFARYVASGADLTIISAHKFLGGLTAGIVAGRADLVGAALLQNSGIGRGFKVGKEGIAGVIAALGAWERRDHDAYRRREEAIVTAWLGRLEGAAGISASLSPDPTGNPITRLRITVQPGTSITAASLAAAMATGAHPVFVRDDEVAHGYFELDPCNLRDGEAEEVASRLLAELRQALRSDVN